MDRMTQRPLALILCSLLVVVVLQFVLTPLGRARDPNFEAAERMRQVAQARVASGEEIVAVIGMESLTASELAEAQKIVETNLEYMRGEITAGSPSAAYLTEFVALIEETGVQAVALGGIIEEKGLYQYARAQGYEVSRDSINQRVESDRAQAAQMGADAAPFHAYAEVVGQDRYWSEIYPQMVERSMVIDQLWNDELSAADSPQGRTERWNRIQDAAVHKQRVEVTNPAVLSDNTVKQAFSYLEQYRRSMQSQR
jgi:hypothetical protein